MKRLYILSLFAFTTVAVSAAEQHEITVSGTTFQLNGEPFQYTGVSFFNAIFNPTFNESSEKRLAWIQKFKDYGINVFRVWAQWDHKRGFVDSGPNSTLYNKDGSLQPTHLKTLKEIIGDADRKGVVIELTLFSRESWNEKIRLGDAESDKAVAALARELLPYRNLTFQMWNEFDRRAVDYAKIVKKIDPKRLVTNSTGYAGVLGSVQENSVMDYLTPHTTRQHKNKHWTIAPAELAYLIARYKKPVVDDEPARCGTKNFGGPSERTYPFDHIVHIYEVLKTDAYITYHHDMFQLGYGDPSIPPSGIPDPEFSPYHRTVFEFLALRDRYFPSRD